MATPSTSLNIVVLLGGPSAEREVSLRSGVAVAAALRGLGHGVHEVDPTPGSLRLPTETDVAFLALHGTYGEDGTVQAELEALGIPYTGCGIESSRIAFDKVLAKERMIGAGVPTPRYRVLRSGSESWPEEGWTCPVVLKPAREGSSVGLQFVETPGTFSEALQASLRHGTEILMEPRIVGRETTVGILDGVALPVVEVRPKSGAYDYRNKYTPGCTDYLCPAGFPGETTVRIQEAALGAFRAV
ncbi:MAG: D-alanine--D-alanine ligase, partial [Verrucomicrobiota bacterium]